MSVLDKDWRSDLFFIGSYIVVDNLALYVPYLSRIIYKLRLFIINISIGSKH